MYSPTGTTNGSVVSLTETDVVSPGSSVNATGDIAVVDDDEKAVSLSFSLPFVDVLIDEGRLVVLVEDVDD